MKLLENKVAIVTGGNSGIGKTTAQLFARHGARVVIAGRTAETGQQVVDDIRAEGGEAIFIKTDVRRYEDCEQLARGAFEHYGQLDIAFNNAGSLENLVPMVDFNLEDWDRVIFTNLFGTFYSLKAQIPYMIKSGGGAIVNMASILAQIGFPGFTASAAAKGGVLSLTKVAAIENSRFGVRVNAIGPALIDTSMISHLDLGSGEDLNPMGRIGTTTDVAELVLWLSSPAASFVTGSLYPIDGGFLAR
ncbi:SDR family NAD(P)-dependent oxidoreductase [Chitinophaga solisilvae]|uniref:SDR family NAD(P)-dependent oxidoreductase n=1 Tax=Chitinophaga solisilvae TaxID=1233460 RepID=UPI00136F6894|nr:SDR family oxidoreductase [Chitinophaga solisilvae]